MAKAGIRIEEEAIGWLIRLRDAREQDWESFTAWLEADPAHAEAYDEVALCDAAAGELSPRSRTAGPRSVDSFATRRKRSPRPWLVPKTVQWSGVAASLLLGLGYLAIGGGYSLETGPGERRQIALSDGSRIELNGNTKLTLDEDRPRFARLDEGEALFHIAHDSAKPFQVETGGTVLRDLGTVFNVVSEDGMLELAVSEGAVLYNPGREAAHIPAGMRLLRPAGSTLKVEPVESDSVGAWRSGRLVYTDARVSRVAADLTRNLGVPIAAHPDVASRTFSGVIMLDGSRSEALRRASALLGVTLSPSGKGWILKAGAGAAS